MAREVICVAFVPFPWVLQQVVERSLILKDSEEQIVAWFDEAIADSEDSQYGTVIAGCSQLPI